MAGATLDKQEVERLAREWEAAFRRGDMATLASLYAEDAKLMPPGSASDRSE
jgi:ketosteroid isomerase-like protein